MNENNLVNIEEILANIPNIKESAVLEMETLNQIDNCLRNMPNFYKSRNAVELTHSNNSLTRLFPLLTENRNTYITTYQTVCGNYDISAHYTTKVFQELDNEPEEVNR